MGEMPIVTAAVEGDLDEALLRRIVSVAGLSLGVVHGRNGKQSLLKSIDGYNRAARFSPWVVLVDLDRTCDCAPPCIAKWLPHPSAQMCFRIAVRAAETWLLADQPRIASWLAVPIGRMPESPDNLDDPKQEIVNLARRSRRRAIQDDLVPRPGSGRAVGPLYMARMIQFIQDEASGWRPERAQHSSDSLARCIRALRRFTER